MSVPRGIANNNPGNIRRGGSAWQGMSASQTDPSFVQFLSPEWGIRAIVKTMRTYKTYGIDTISGAISRWAPEADGNNTAAYIAAVCKECSLEPTDEVDVDDIMPLLVKAIIWQENGCQPYTDQQIQVGISLV